MGYSHSVCDCNCVGIYTGPCRAARLMVVVVMGMEVMEGVRWLARTSCGADVKKERRGNVKWTASISGHVKGDRGELRACSANAHSLVPPIPFPRSPLSHVPIPLLLTSSCSRTPISARLRYWEPHRSY